MGTSSFSFRQFTIWQDKCAMKVGTDGTLLGAWAYASQGTKQHILDVGTGTGLIAIMMAQRLPEAKVIGIEIDPVAASQAQQNVTSSPFSSRVSISCQSFQEHAKQAGLALYDAIVCNPPFFSQSLTCPESLRTQARHTVSLTYTTLLQLSKAMLRPHGTLSVIIPTTEREKMEQAVAVAGMFCMKSCSVRTSERKSPKRLLLCFSKEPCDFEQQEMTIGDAYYQKLTNPFYMERKLTGNQD